MELFKTLTRPLLLKEYVMTKNEEIKELLNNSDNIINVIYLMLKENKVRLSDYDLFYFNKKYYNLDNINNRKIYYKINRPMNYNYIHTRLSANNKDLLSKFSILETDKLLYHIDEQTETIKYYSELYDGLYKYCFRPSNKKRLLTMIEIYDKFNKINNNIDCYTDLNDNIHTYKKEYITNNINDISEYLKRDCYYKSINKDMTIYKGIKDMKIYCYLNNMLIKLPLTLSEALKECLYINRNERLPKLKIKEYVYSYIKQKEGDNYTEIEFKEGTPGYLMNYNRVYKHIYYND